MKRVLAGLALVSVAAGVGGAPPRHWPDPTATRRPASVVPARLPRTDSIAPSRRAGRTPPADRHDAVRRGLSAASALFVENRGQVGRHIRYYLPGSAATIGFDRYGASYEMPADAPAGDGTRGWIVRHVMLGTGTRPDPVGEGRTAATMSFFSGSRSPWTGGAATYRSVVYRDPWPGIDVSYTAGRGAVEYSFLVDPGADPGDIRFAYRGASVRLRSDGALAITTPVRSFADRRPVAFQVVDGRRMAVSASFRPLGRVGGAAFGIRIGPYDPSLRLVVDPVSIAYAGYIGGSGHDQGLAVAEDGAGNAYVVGQTKSDQRTFPVRVGPDLTLNGQTDAFVCKVSPAGALVYCGYMGGSEPDRGRGVDVDAQGNAYVYGWTRSREGDGFPVTVGPDLTYNKGSSDTFICKVDATGTSLVYCGYIGGSDHDEGKAVAVDGSGAAVVTGGTKSSDMVATAGFGTTYGGDGDVFVAKVKPDGTALEWLGYVGGSGSEHARGVGIGPDGSVSFAGTTESDQRSLPVRVGPDLTYNGGGGDAFVGRITPDASSLVYLGYVGGNGFDDARDADVGGAGNLFLCGHTASTQATFPVKTGPDLTYNGGKDDAFVAAVLPTGALRSAGFVGGSAADACYGIAVDHAGDAFLGGRTFSKQSTFPVVGGPDSTYNGDGDAFAAEVAAGGGRVAWCGYVGGWGKDVSWALAVDAAGQVPILSGGTFSTQSSFPAKAGPDPSYNGGGDAFVVRLTG